MRGNYLSISIFIDKFCIDIPVALPTFTYNSVCYCRYMSAPSSDCILYKCEVCNKTFNSQQEIEQRNKEMRIQTAGQKE